MSGRPSRLMAPRHRGKDPSCPPRQIQFLKLLAQAPFPLLSRSRVPGSGVRRKKRPPQPRSSPANLPVEQQEIMPTPTPWISLGASELQVTLKAGLPNPIGAAPSILHTHTHALLNGSTSPKVHTQVCQPTMPGVNETHQASQREWGGVADGHLPDALYRGKAWGTTCYLSSTVSRKEASDKRPGKPSCPCLKPYCIVYSSNVLLHLEFCPRQSY